MMLVFKKKQIIEETKPKLVFWYLLFDGDQEKIKSAFADGYGLQNEENFSRVMNGVNLDDYVMLLEKDFRKFTKTGKEFIVKREKPYFTDKDLEGLVSIIKGEDKRKT